MEGHRQKASKEQHDSQRAPVRQASDVQGSCQPKEILWLAFYLYMRRRNASPRNERQAQAQVEAARHPYE